MMMIYSIFSYLIMRSLWITFCMISGEKSKFYTVRIEEDDSRDENSYTVRIEEDDSREEDKVN